jgi:8-amino-7-oxononanoate synthase
VVADGFCTGCGASAPLPDYLACTRERGGRLAIDDTQALGVIGPGGGGSLARSGLGGSGVLSIASLAKGLGVPVAVLSGPRADVDWFERHSETRTHTSPPAQPLVRAAGAALDANERIGDRLRRRLAELVGRFRRALGAFGVVPSGGLFPVQGLGGMTVAAARALHEALLRRGVRTVLHGDHMRPGGRVSFVITAAHSEADVDAAAGALRAVVRRPDGGHARRRPGERRAAASSR